MKSPDVLIREYNATPNNHYKDVTKRVQILIELSRDQSRKSQQFIYTEFRAWNQNPSYLFELLEEFLTRQDERFYKLLVDFFDKEDKYLNTWWKNSDDDQYNEMQWKTWQRYRELKTKYQSERENLEKKWQKRAFIVPVIYNKIFPILSRMWTYKNKKGKRTEVGRSVKSNAVLCEKCHIYPARPFTFHYGKFLAQETAHSFNVTQTTTRYQVCGQQDVMICSNCINKYRAKWFFIGLGVAIFLFSMLMLVRGSAPEFDILFSCLIFSPVLALVTLAIMGTHVELGRGDGEKMAIALKRIELEKRGFHVFWKSKEFKKLRLE